MVVHLYIAVLHSPLVFLDGLVEIYASSIWTLAYQDLRVMERPVNVPSPTFHTPLIPTHRHVG